MLNKVIITGAGGFVGINLCNTLVQQGTDVIAIGISDKPKELISDNKLTYIKHDVFDIFSLLDKSEYANIFSNIDAFIHLAWAGTSGPNRSNIELQLKNIQMSVECLKFANQIKCKKFIGAGSIQEKESYIATMSNDNISSSYIYGASKYLAHNLCKLADFRDCTELCWVIITNIYGPGENSPRFINTTIRKLLNKEELQFSSATQNYDFIYIDDAINALISIAEKGKNGSQYVIGSGEAQPLKNFILRIINVVDSTAIPHFSNIEGINLPLEDYDNANLLADTEFKINTPFEEGIRKTTDWIKKNL